MYLEDVEELLVKSYNEAYDRGEFKAVDFDGLSWSDVEEIFEWNTKGIDVFEFDGRKVEKAEFDTGGEGHAEDVYMVFKTTDTDGTVQYWRKDGWYASHYGTDWDGPWREVNAVERVVTFYE